MMAPTNRREFLATASAATLSALAAGLPRVARGQAIEKIAPTADAVIVLWMAGGMAHTETFDPKRFTPYTPGLAPDQVLEHVSRHRHGRRPHQVLAGPRAHR